jgi:hypothetical protein
MTYAELFYEAYRVFGALADRVVLGPIETAHILIINENNAIDEQSAVCVTFPDIEQLEPYVIRARLVNAYETMRNGLNLRGALVGHLKGMEA